MSDASAASSMVSISLIDMSPEGLVIVTWGVVFGAVVEAVDVDAVVVVGSEAGGGSGTQPSTAAAATAIVATSAPRDFFTGSASSFGELSVTPRIPRWWIATGTLSLGSVPSSLPLARSS